jgi:ABC-type sugar transport system substrate-binding protein
MKKSIATLAARLLTSAAFMLATTPAAAADVAINIGIPAVVVQPRPVYIQPQYESEWRERQVRAAAWRSNPTPVVVVQHAHPVHKKHHHKHHGKHHGKHNHKHDD